MNNSFTVIGFARRSGNYNGHDYDNHVFYLSRDAIDKYDEVGLIVDVVKIRTDRLESIPHINDIVTPLYDRFGHCVGFL